MFNGCKTVLFGCLILLSNHSLIMGGDEHQIRVAVDPRVELVSLVFRLAGSPEYNMGQVPAYAAAADAAFVRYKDHAVVKTAQRLRAEFGVSFDACMSMAVHLPPIEDLEKNNVFAERPSSLEKRWTKEEAARFQKQLAQFVRDTSFSDFLTEHHSLYRTSEERVHQILKNAELDWFDNFFAKRPGARFTLALGLLNGGANYGVHVDTQPGSEDLYCVLGVWMVDAAGLPRFEDGMISTVAHEFCHSYVNPLVHAHRDALRKGGETLFSQVQHLMEPQAYRTWETMVCESLVRASVVRYLYKTRGPAAAEKEIQEQAQEHFPWVGQLSRVLATYERERGPNGLSPFMPAIVSFFEGTAVEVGKNQAEKPKLVSITPGNGEEVVPGRQTMTLVFDRPMRPGSFSFVGGGPSFPEMEGIPRYDDTGKVLRVVVHLKPEWTYRFSLNSAEYTAFKSAEGSVLDPIRISFTTGKQQ